MMENEEKQIPEEQGLNPAEESIPELPQEPLEDAVQAEPKEVAAAPLQPTEEACEEPVAQEAVYTVPETEDHTEPAVLEPAYTAPEKEEEDFADSQPVRKSSPYEDSPYVMNHAPQVPQKTKKRRKAGRFWKTLVCTVLILALVGGACFGTAYMLNSVWEERVENMEASFNQKISDLQQQLKYSGNGISTSGSPNTTADGSLTPAQVYAKNVQSVVMIYNVVANGTATGSGFVLTEDGYIVTNYHVVEGGGTLSVVTCLNEEYSAKLIGYDSTNDVALLKVEAEGLQAVTIGSSSDLIVGDQVVAIGNPLGELTSTLTVGYISAMERDVNTDGFAINMLQTDAAINSGNSGGPLFNMKGEVIGITTAKYSGTSSSGATIEGVGFAIPIDDVTGLLSDLATYGYIRGAYLGVSVSDMDPNAASYYGLPLGAYVQSVDKGFAAERAGIKAKDIIVNLGGIEIETVNDLTKALRGFAAGDMTLITVYRGGKELTLTITLDEKPTTPVE